ncbi:MAG: tetratricopeptide repeat protein [Terriglobia bacterium]
MKRRITIFGFLVFWMAAALFSGAAQEKKPEPPLSKLQIEGLVGGGVYSARIAALVEQRGIDFKPAAEDLSALRQAGAQDVLIQAILAAKIHLPSPAPGRAQALDYLSAAGRLEQRKMWPQAEQQYRAALSLQPQDATIFLALGRVQEKQGKDAEAIEDYRQAIRLQAGLAGAHQKLGALLYSKGDLEGAVAEYRAEAALKPNDAAAYFRLGNALYVSARLDEAIAEFRNALRLNPGSKEAHAALGDALLKEGDRKGALAEYRKSLADNSDDPALPATFDWLSKALAP